MVNKSTSLPKGSARGQAPYYDCCEKPNITEYRGIHVCRNCGLVQEPILLEYNISTGIAKDTLHTERGNTDPYANRGSRTTFSVKNLSPVKVPLFRRLAKLNNAYNNSTIEANLQSANRILHNIASHLEIPQSIYPKTLHLYKKVLDLRLTVGRSIKKLMTASLYITCQNNQLSRPIEEFSEVSQIPVKMLRRYSRLIRATFNIKLKRFSTFYYTTQFSIKLRIPFQAQSFAKTMLKAITERGVATRCNPRGFAAAAIYIVTRKFTKLRKISQRILTNISGVSEVTIRKYIKIIENSLDLQEQTFELPNNSPKLQHPLEFLHSN